MPTSNGHLNIKKPEDILQLLDTVVETGTPAELERKGKRLIISPAEKYRNLDKLVEHPDFLIGNLEELVHLDWSSEWKPQV